LAGFLNTHTAILSGYYISNCDALNDYGLIEFSPDHGETLDIWCVTKENGKYGDPTNIGTTISTGKSESQPTISENRTIFYAGDVRG
jgi:hypothetical protein